MPWCYSTWKGLCTLEEKSPQKSIYLNLPFFCTANSIEPSDKCNRVQWPHIRPKNMLFYNRFFLLQKYCLQLHTSSQNMREKKEEIVQGEGWSRMYRKGDPAGCLRCLGQAKWWHQSKLIFNPWDMRQHRWGLQNCHFRKILILVAMRAQALSYFDSDCKLLLFGTCDNESKNWSCMFRAFLCCSTCPKGLNSIRCYRNGEEKV